LAEHRRALATNSGRPCCLQTERSSEETTWIAAHPSSWPEASASRC
jgi:hypothetical protein